MTYFIDLHAIQSFPSHCLNRDDVGAPKDAVFGGHRRARISSQCSKRAIRQHFKSAGLFSQEELGIRTRNLIRLIVDRIPDANPQLLTTATTNALATLKLSAKDDAKKKSKKTEEPPLEEELKFPQMEYLLFFSSETIRLLSEIVKGNLENLVNNEISSDLKKEIRRAVEANCSPDLACFGRMVANDKSLSIDAAVQVAHPIGTGKLDRESDYFTAIDDFTLPGDAEAGHLDSKEFNSSTFYRYASINFDLLVNNLGGDQELAMRTIEAFATAFVMAIPTGSQNTFAANTLPATVITSVHNTQPLSLANAFVKPIWHGDHKDGVVAASTERLLEELHKLEATYELKMSLVTMDTTGVAEQNLVPNLSTLIQQTTAALN